MNCAVIVSAITIKLLAYGRLTYKTGLCPNTYRNTAMKPKFMHFIIQCLQPAKFAIHCGEHGVDPSCGADSELQLRWDFWEQSSRSLAVTINLNRYEVFLQLVYYLTSPGPKNNHPGSKLPWLPRVRPVGVLRESSRKMWEYYAKNKNRIKYIFSWDTQLERMVYEMYTH